MHQHICAMLMTYSQHVIYINNDDNPLKKNLFLLVRLHMHYLLGNVKALKSSNAQQEENCHPSYELLKISLKTGR